MGPLIVDHQRSLENGCAVRGYGEFRLPPDRLANRAGIKKRRQFPGTLDPSSRLERLDGGESATRGIAEKNVRWGVNGGNTFRWGAAFTPNLTVLSLPVPGTWYPVPSTVRFGSVFVITQVMLEPNLT